MASEKITRECPDLFLGKDDASSLSRLLTHLDPRPELKFEAVPVPASGTVLPPPLGTGSRTILIAQAPDHAPQLALIGHSRGVDITLNRGIDFILHVTDEQDRPLQSVRAALIPIDICLPVAEVFADLLVRKESAASGERITFSGVSSGLYALRVLAREMVVSTITPLPVSGERSEVHVRLQRGASLRGELGLPSAAPPVAGRVRAVWRAGHGRLEWTDTAFSAGDSRFDLKNLPAIGTVHLLGWTAAGDSSRLQTLTNLYRFNGTLPDPLTLSPSSPWTGTLPPTDPPGRVLARAGLSRDFLLDEPPEPVWISVGPEGRITIPDVPAFADEIRLIAPGMGALVIPREGRSKGAGGRLDLREMSTLEGKAAWDDGSPLVGATLSPPEAPGAFCIGPSMEDGRFACASPTPLGDVSPLRVTIAGVVRKLEARGPEPFSLTPRTGPILEIRIKEPPVRRLPTLRVAVLGPGTTGTPGGAGEADAFYIRPDRGLLSFPRYLDPPFQLSISYPGGAPKTSRSFPSESVLSRGPVAIELPLAPSIPGVVISAGDRKPLGGAEVEILPEHGAVSPLPPSWIRHADTSGKWIFGDLAEGVYILSASAPGFDSATRRILLAPEGGPNPVEFLLRSPGSIEGRVLGIEAGDEVTLKLVRLGESLLPKSSDRRAVPDSEGRFGFVAVSEGMYQVLCERGTGTPGPSSLRSLYVEVRSHETTQVEFNFQTGIRLSGKAFLGEDLLTEATLIFGRRAGPMTVERARSDAEGRYMVFLPEVGGYSVFPESGELELKGQTELLFEIERTEKQEKDLHFPVSSLQGRVVRLDGSGCPDVELNLFEDNVPGRHRAFRYRTASGTDGSFRMPYLTPGDYLISATPRSLGSRTFGPFKLEANTNLPVGDLVLGTGVTVRVMAFGPAGEPLAGAGIRAFPNGDYSLGNIGGFPYAETDSRGEAILQDVESGTYTLVGIYPSMAPAILDGFIVKPDPPDEPAMLPFSRGGSLAITVIGVNGEPRPSLRPLLFDEQGRDSSDFYQYLNHLAGRGFLTDKGGMVYLDPVLPGTYVIRLTGRDELPGLDKVGPVTVRVSEGQTTPVVVTVK